MTRILQIIATIIVFAVAPITAADHYWGNGFLDKFLVEQSLPIMGTILAIYIAASASFLGIVLTHESQRQEIIFKGTVTELKHNILFVIVILVLHLFIMVATPAATKDNECLITLLKAAKVFTFVLYIYALYELSHVLFGIRDTINKNGK